MKTVSRILDVCRVTSAHFSSLSVSSRFSCQTLGGNFIPRRNYPGPVKSPSLNSQWLRVERPDQPAFLKGKLHYEIGVRADAPLVLEFVGKNFVPDGNLQASIGATAKELSDYYEEVVDRSLEKPFSILAFRGDELCAVLLSTERVFGSEPRKGPKPQFTIPKTDYCSVIDCGKYKERAANKISTFIKTLDNDLENVFPESRRLIFLEVTSVIPSLREKGISQEMTELTLKLAESYGFDHAAAVATSKAGQKLLIQKLNFTKERELLYANFLENGHPVFPETPNEPGALINGQLLGKRLCGAAMDCL